MDSQELAEHLNETDPNNTPYYPLLIVDNDQPAWWACNLCGASVGDTPCPDHAPTDIPGLALVDCDANPRHWVWYHDGEWHGYGNPCPECRLGEYYEKDRQARRCRHWPWRRWRISHRVAGWCYTLGVTSGGGSWTYGDGHSGCMGWLPSLRGKRVYILGVKREVWQCWRQRHRCGEEVGFGFCGKCVPWSCCGSEREAHAAGCVEDDQRAVAA
jgi:hypothetical protein